ncbi:MAG: hypothetical protein INH41_04915 [Myxococcaceae bacterium]|nr:hypothetical protein [Myxococcaceae bacterium]
MPSNPTSSSAILRIDGVSVAPDAASMCVSALAGLCLQQSADRPSRPGARCQGLTSTGVCDVAQEVERCQPRTHRFYLLAAQLAVPFYGVLGAALVGTGVARVTVLPFVFGLSLWVVAALTAMHRRSFG